MVFSTTEEATDAEEETEDLDDTCEDSETSDETALRPFLSILPDLLDILSSYFYRLLWWVTAERVK